MESFENTPEEMAALELYHQLCNLSPEGERAIHITLRMPNCRYVGDVWLGLEDMKRLADACMSLALVRETAEAAAPLPADDKTVTEKDVTDVIAGFENLLGGE